MKPTSEKITNSFLLVSKDPLTLADRRFYSCMLLNLKAQIAKRDGEITLPKLANVFSYGLPTADQVVTSIKKFINTSIEYHETSQGILLKEFCPLLDYVKFDYNMQAIYYRFSEKASQLLAKPEFFAMHIIQAHFIYKYSNQLYSILSKAFYQQCYNFEIQVSELRSNLGVSEGKLSNFNDFKRFVLEPSLAEINAHASFNASFLVINKGRKIVSLSFSLTNKDYEYQHVHGDYELPAKLEQLFSSNLVLSALYGHLINSRTEERERFFKLACKKAEAQKRKFTSEEVDIPELWFELVIDELAARFNEKS